jgi:hypothetical protein
MKNNIVRIDSARSDKGRRGKSTQKPLTQEELSDLESLGLKPFTQEYKRLRNLVTDKDDFSSSKASYALLRAQLSNVIQAIGVMDKTFVKCGGRNAYAYCAVHTLARELSHDLRAFCDQTEVAERIRDVIVQSGMRALAADIVQDIIRTRQ